MQESMKYLLSLILLFVLLGCSSDDYRLSLEDQVYEFVFNEAVETAHEEVVIYRNQYSYDFLSGKSYSELIKEYDEIGKFPKGLIIRLIEKTEQPTPLTWKPIMVNGVMADFDNPNPPKAMKERMGFWKEFYRTYPDTSGYFLVSRVEVDSKSNEAVLLFSYRCAALCGAHDSIIHVKKYGTEWKLENGHRFWVS